MTKKRLHKLYNACRPALLIFCREDKIPDWMRKEYDREIKSVYYSFDTWYESVLTTKDGEDLTNEEIYYTWFYVWQPNKPVKKYGEFYKYLSRGFRF